MALNEIGMGEAAKLSGSMQKTENNAYILDLLIDRIDFFFGVFDYETETTHIYSNLRKRYLIPEYVSGGAEGIIATGSILPDSFDDLKSLFAEILTSSTALRRDIHMADSEGSRPWFRISLVPISYDNKTKAKQAFLFAINITPQVLAEERYKNELHRKLGFEENLIALCSADLYSKKVIMYDSDKPVKPIDIFPGDPLEKAIDTFVNTAIREEDRKFLSKMVELSNLSKAYEESKALSHTYLRQAAGGDYLWVTTDIRLLKDPQNEHLLVFAYTFDATREKLSELALKQVVESSYAFVGVLDMITKNFLFVTHEKKKHSVRDSYENYDYVINFFSEKMKPYYVDANEFHNMLDAFSMNGIKRNLAHSEQFELDVRMYDENRKIRTSRISFSYFDSFKTQVLICRRDISDELEEDRRRNHEISAALDEARQANIEKSQLYSRINRDIRIPLSEITRLTRLAETSSDTAYIKECIGKIREVCSSLANVVADTGTSESFVPENSLRFETVNPNDIIKRIEAHYGALIKERHIEYTLTVVDGAISCIKTDADAVEQIFSQILSNSIAFTPCGGKINAVIECRDVDDLRNNCTVTITDSGIGMSEEFLPHIFEPFAREDISLIGKSGSGLGMSIVKNRVDALGGSIDVKSVKGKGTTVRVFLPFEKGELVADSEAISAIEDFDARILYCDDNTLSAEITKHLLVGKGCTVDHVSSGKQGVALFAASQPWAYDLILMDIRMPDMDGLAATRAIRALDRVDAKKVPIAAYTVNSLKSDTLKSIEAGMNAHIVKPADPAKLLKTLKKLCENK